MTSKTLVTLSICLFLLIPLAMSKVRENVIVNVAAGQRDCYFFTPVNEGDWINIEYQVTSASGVLGNFDLEVEILDPHGDPLFMEQEGDYADFEGKASIGGDHEICLDNSMSSTSAKSVYLSIAVTDPDDGYYEWDLHEQGDHFDFSQLDQTLDGFDSQTTFPLFRDKLLFIHKSLSHSSRIQAMMVANHAQDMQMALANNEKVVVWSLIHLFLVLLIGCIQVALVKSLFSENKRLLYTLFNSTDDKESNCQQTHTDQLSIPTGAAF